MGVGDTHFDNKAENDEIVKQEGYLANKTYSDNVMRNIYQHYL